MFILKKKSLFEVGLIKKSEDIPVDGNAEENSTGSIIVFELASPR